jgi:ankyrin repeat protein
VVALLLAAEAVEVPLSMAAEQGDEKVVKALLDAGADPNAAHRTQLRPLIAATKGRHAGVVALLIEAGADPNPGSPIFIAVHHGDEGIIGSILSAGGRLDLTCTYGHDEKPLALAAVQSKGNQLAILKLLLDAGVDPNAGHRVGVTALMHACEEGNHPVVRLLLDTAGIDIQRRRNGLTAADYARRGGHGSIAGEVDRKWLEMAGSLP